MTCLPNWTVLYPILYLESSSLTTHADFWNCARVVKSLRSSNLRSRKPRRTFCNKLEMDGRRTRKSNNKYHCPVTIHFKFITKCDSLFYYKMRWSVITKYDSFFITKCYKCYNYKVRQLLQSATNLLQSATEHTHHQLFLDTDMHFNLKFSREMFLFIWIVY